MRGKKVSKHNIKYKFELSKNNTIQNISPQVITFHKPYIIHLKKKMECCNYNRVALPIKKKKNKSVVH